MENKKHALPTAEQLEWADCELGALIHWDLEAFQPYYFRDNFGWNPPLSVFDPDQLDTDQWVKAAADMGAKYAVLISKHCSGFCLWPTDAHEFSVKNTPYKNGKGDVVGEFVASCRKYGLRPGLYYSISCNNYLTVDDPGLVYGRPDEKLTPEQKKVRQEEYHRIVMQQLTEIWTRYGDLFEIWFDGGVMPEDQGGPPVASLLHKLQPNANVFQGPAGTRSLLRWVGNENGLAPVDTSCIVTDKDGNETWAPAETDTPNRRDLWFWHEGEEDKIVPAEKLMQYYLESVGRNTNLLLGMVIDKHGRFPEPDTAVFHQFGEERRRRFGKPSAECAGEGASFTLEVNGPVRDIILMENIALGERVSGYHVDLITDDGEETAFTGKIIGHKRILSLPEPKNVRAVRLTIDQSRDIPQIRSFAVYPG